MSDDKVFIEIDYGIILHDELVVAPLILCSLFKLPGASFSQMINFVGKSIHTVYMCMYTMSLMLLVGFFIFITMTMLYHAGDAV